MFESDESHVPLGPGYPERLGLVKREEGLEIHIRLIHDIKRVWFRREPVKLVAVMSFAVRDVDIGRYASSQVEQCMHLDRALAVFPQSPCRELYAGRYGRGIQGINHVVYGYVGQLSA